MSPETLINREAGDKAKGPRLQRLRCVLLIMDAIKKSDRPHIYAAVEHKEDVFIKHASDGKDYLEQAKNYDLESAFTFNSPEVINSMIGFCDLWVEYGLKNKELYLGFYATNKIGSENSTARIKSLGIDLPEDPILEILQRKEFTCKNLLSSIVPLILAEYKEQYNGKNGKSEGFIKVLEGFTNTDWIEFLNMIDFKFGELDEVKTKKLAIEEVRSCKFFNSSCTGQEEMILSKILDLLDERQCAKDPLGKFVNVSDVQLIYVKASANQTIIKGDDPIYKIWNSLEKPTDKRSLKDKVTSVCRIYEEKNLNLLARKTAGSRILQDDKANDKSFLSLRYRIYEKCEEELHHYLASLPTGSLSNQDEVDKLFDFLKGKAKSHVETLSGDFSYSIKSEPVIEGIILELFDSCFLALN